MGKLWRRVLFWFRANRLEAELAEELELHRAMTQERLERSGTPLPEAAHASRRALGNLALAREDARRVWIGPWLESVAQDVAYAVRTIRRAPGFAASMILVLALGIGATACVFGLIDALVLRSLPVHEPDRLVYLGRPAFSYPIFTELRSRSPHIFSDLVAWNLEREPVQWHTEFEPSEVLTVSGRFYSALGVSAVLGRTFTADDDEIGGGADGPVAVISHACWQ